MSEVSTERNIVKGDNKPFDGGVKCKYCNGIQVIKKGKRKTGQMYRCKECGKYFYSKSQQGRLALLPLVRQIAANRVVPASLNKPSGEVAWPQEQCWISVYCLLDQTGADQAQAPPG